MKEYHKQLSVLLVLIMALVLASCGPTAAPAEPTAAPAEPTKAEAEATPEPAVEEKPSGKIVFLNNGSLKWDPATVYNMDRCKEILPDIEVEVVEENDTLARMSALVAGGGEAFDVVELADVDTPQFIQIGALLPLDELFPEEELARYPEGTLDVVTGPDGSIYGKPHFVLPQVLMWNTELLSEAGFDKAPETWDEIVEYGKALTHGDQWGYAFGLAPNRDTYYIYASYLYQAGGDMFNDDFTAAFNSDAGKQALQFIVDARNTHEIAPPGVNTYDGDDTMNLFIRGQGATVQNWGFTIDRAMNLEESVVKEVFDVAPLPKGPSGELAGYLVTFPMVVPASSTNPEAAKAFVDCMTTKESQKYMLLEEPGNVVVPPDVFDISEVQEGVPFASVLQQMVAASRSEYHPKSGEVVTIMVEEVQAAVAEVKTVEEALTDAEARVNALAGEAAAAAPAEEEEVEKPSGKIVFLNNGALTWDPATAYNLERFREAHPEIEVEVVEENDTLARMSALVAGGGEAFDVVEQADVDCPQFIQIGAFLPLDDLFPPEELARYPEGTLAAMTGPDGSIYGKPHFVLPQVLMYNTELLAEAGYDRPPETWDEIIEYGQELTKGDQWGYAYGLAPNRDTYYIFASYLYQAGGKLFNDDFGAAFNSDEGKQALQFISDLRNKYKIVPPGVNTYDGDDTMNLFIRGQGATVQNWGFTIDRAMNLEESVVEDSFGVATLPTGPSGETTGYLVTFPMLIPTSSSNPEAAKVFVDFMTSKESQKYMLLKEPGNVVVPPDVFDIPEVIETVPFAQVLRGSVAGSQAEYHPKSGEVVTILVEEIQAAVAEQKTVEQALADAESRVNALTP